MELGGICRTCLRRGQPVWPLFEENHELFAAGTPLVEFINMFTEIMIFRMEGFPEQICMNCLNDIKRAYAFKLRCEYSEMALYHHQASNGIINLDNLDDEMDFIKGAAGLETSSDDLKNDECIMDTSSDDNNFDITNCIYDFLQVDTIDGDDEGFKVNLQAELDASLEQQMYYKSRLEGLNGDCRDYDREDANDEEMGNILVCSACPESFRNRDLLKMHVIDYHTDGKLCILCNEEFDCIRMHTDKHLLPRLQCSHCDQKFEYRPLLNAHLRTHMIKNKDTGKLEFKCERCTKTFTSHHEFMIHKRTHSEDRPFSCDTCGMAFKRRDKLKAHMTSHSDARPFECTLCQSRFKRKDNLSSHMKSVHQQGDKIFKCDICDKAFRFKDKLKAHMNTHLRLFSCETCHAGFPRKESLDRHIEQKHRSIEAAGGVVVTTENIVPVMQSPEPKSFQCTICKKDFAAQDALTNHMKMHVKKVELKCELCSKVFGQSNKLKSHMITHTDLRPFQCTFCPSVFKRKDNLNRHMKKHTRSRVGNKMQPCNSDDKVDTECNTIKCDDDRVQENNDDNCDNTMTSTIIDVSQLNDSSRVISVNSDINASCTAGNDNAIASDAQINSDISQGPNTISSLAVLETSPYESVHIQNDHDRAFEIPTSPGMNYCKSIDNITVEENALINGDANHSADLSTQSHPIESSHTNNESINGSLSHAATPFSCSENPGFKTDKIKEQLPVISKNPFPSDSYTIASLLGRKENPVSHKNNINAIVVSLSGDSNSSNPLKVQTVNNTAISSNHDNHTSNNHDSSVLHPRTNNSIYNTHITPQMNKSDTTICLENIESV